MARVRNIAFVIVSILAVLAGYLYWNWSATRQRKEADEQSEIVEVLTDADPSVSADNEKFTDAMVRLGARYANGHGLPKNYSLALKLFERAAAKGNAEASRP